MCILYIYVYMHDDLHGVLSPLPTGQTSRRLCYDVAHLFFSEARYCVTHNAVCGRTNMCMYVYLYMYVFSFSYLSNIYAYMRYIYIYVCLLVYSLLRFPSSCRPRFWFLIYFQAFLNHIHSSTGHKRRVVDSRDPFSGCLQCGCDVSIHTPSFVHIHTPTFDVYIYIYILSI